MAATIEDYGDYSFMPVAKAAKQDVDANGICASVFAAFIGSREARAKDLVAAHWATLSDSELAALGLSAQEIGDVRANIRA